MDNENPVPAKVTSEERAVARRRPAPSKGAEDPVGPKITNEDRPAAGQQPSLSKWAKWRRRYGVSLFFMLIAGSLVFGAVFLLPSDVPTYTPGAFGISQVVSHAPITSIAISVTPHGTDHAVDIGCGSSEVTAREGALEPAR